MYVNFKNCPLDRNHHMYDGMCEYMHWKGHLKRHAKCSILWEKSSKLENIFFIEYYAAFKEDVCKDYLAKWKILIYNIKWKN